MDILAVMWKCENNKIWRLLFIKLGLNFKWFECLGEYPFYLILLYMNIEDKFESMVNIIQSLYIFWIYLAFLTFNLTIIHQNYETWYHKSKISRISYDIQQWNMLLLDFLFYEHLFRLNHFLQDRQNQHQSFVTEERWRDK